MRVVVTGGIGAGKTTLTKALAAHLPGYEVASVDDMVRALYNRADYCSMLRSLTGTDDRSEVSRIVFENPALRDKLQIETRQFLGLDLHRLLTSGKPVLLEFALLLERERYLGLTDYLVCASADERLRRERVEKRDGLPADRYAQVLAAQYPQELKEALADRVVRTDVEAPEFERDVLATALEIRGLDLRSRFLQFFGTTPGAEALWNAVRDRYSEPHRHYHRLGHLAELFDALAPWISVRNPHPHYQAIELAVWFHDIVYETEGGGHSSNEARSARVMVDLLRQHCPHFLENASHYASVMHAAQFILATQQHSLRNPYLQSRPDLAEACSLFLDADMSILAAPSSRFALYDEQIAREWHQDPASLTSEYVSARMDFLLTVLQQPRLFLSHAFAQQEGAARNNLKELLTRIH